LICGVTVHIKFDASIRRLIRYNPGHDFHAKDLPDDPVLLKQLLAQMLSERESDKGKIVHLEEENALLRQRLFGRKSEQTVDPPTPQMALFNEAESVASLSTKRWKKRS